MNIFLKQSVNGRYVLYGVERHENFGNKMVTSVLLES